MTTATGPADRRRRRRGSVERWLRRRAVALVLLPLLAVTASGGWLHAHSRQRAALEALQAVAQVKSLQVLSWIASLHHALEAFDSDGRAARELRQVLAGEGGAAARGALLASMERLRRAHPWLAEVSLVDLRGRLVASTAPRAPGLYLGEHRWFERGLAGPTVEVQTRGLSSTVEGGLEVVAAAPVLDARGRALGVLAGRAAPQALDRIVGSRAGLGRTGKAYLVAEDGVLITSTASPVQIAGQTFRASAGLVAARDARAQILMAGADAGGREVLGCYTWIPELRAVLVAELDREEALAPALAGLRLDAAVALAALAAALLAAFLSARRITRPLARLRAAADRVAAGDLSPVPGPFADDELGDLGLALGEMVRRLDRRSRADEIARTLSRRLAGADADAVEGIVAETLPRLGALLGARRAFVQLEPGTGGARLRSWAEGEAIARPDGTPPPPALEAAALARGEILCLPAPGAAGAAPGEEPARTLVAVPAVAGGLRATLALELPGRIDRLSADDEAVLQGMAGVIGGALARTDLERRHRLLAEHAGDVIATLDLATRRYTFVSPAVTAARGLSVGEALAEPLERSLTPASHARALELLARVGTPREVARFTEIFEQPCRDGTVKQMEVTGTLVRDPLGRPVSVVLVARDASARIEAERALRRLAAAVDQAPLSIVITDASGHIEYVNPAFERITGWPAAEVLGKNPRFLKSGRQDPEFYRRLWEAITAGRTWEGQFVNVRRDGRGFTEQAIIAPVRDEGGAIRSFVAVKRDITRELELAEQLAHAQRMESIGRLAGGVAHDFNNLLTVIIATASAMGDALRAGEPVAAEDVSEVRDAALRGRDLTRQLLAFARRQPLEQGALDLGDELRRSAALLRRVLGADVVLSVSAPPDLWHIRGDGGQLEQILMNLGANARDAMPSGGHVELRAENLAAGAAEAARFPGLAPGEYVRITLRDSGAGMAPETLARAFEPFFTTKPFGQGTGLGLSTVHGIVTVSGGVIRVESAPGEGTLLEICLPRHPGARDARAPGSPP